MQIALEWSKSAMDLTFMGPCIVRIFQYTSISNKMQRYTVYFIWKLLYMFRVVPPPIIRSEDNCIYSIWYLSDRYCYLPLSWKSWTWFECAVGGPTTNTARLSPWYEGKNRSCHCIHWAPDNGRENARNMLSCKSQDNKLKNWCIRLVIYLNCAMMHGHANLKFYI